MFVKYLSVHLAVGCTKHGLMLLVYVENTSIHRTVGIKMALFALEINLVGSRKPAIWQSVSWQWSKSRWTFITNFVWAYNDNRS